MVVWRLAAVGLAVVDDLKNPFRVVCLKAGAGLLAGALDGLLGTIVPSGCWGESSGAVKMMETFEKRAKTVEKFEEKLKISEKLILRDIFVMTFHMLKVGQA